MIEHIELYKTHWNADGVPFTTYAIWEFSSLTELERFCETNEAR